MTWKRETLCVAINCYYLPPFLVLLSNVNNAFGLTFIFLVSFEYQQRLTNIYSQKLEKE